MPGWAGKPGKMKVKKLTEGRVKKGHPGGEKKGNAEENGVAKGTAKQQPISVFGVTAYQLIEGHPGLPGRQHIKVGKGPEQTETTSNRGGQKQNCHKDTRYSDGGGEAQHPPKKPRKKRVKSGHKKKKIPKKKQKEWFVGEKVFTRRGDTKNNQKPTRTPRKTLGTGKKVRNVTPGKNGGPPGVTNQGEVTHGWALKKKNRI